MHKIHIIVLGSNGQIGYALYKASKISPYHKIFKFTFLRRKDIDFAKLDTQTITEILLPLKANIIINAAAYTAVDKAENEPENANIINNIAVQIIAKFCQLNNIALIHYSTDYIFDGIKKLYIESDAATPLNVYGHTKYLGEQAIINNLDKYLIFRTTWVYDTRGNNFVLTMLKLAAQNQELNIVSDQYGSPTWAYTIASTTLEVLSKIDYYNFNEWWGKYTGIYNLTSALHTNWYEFAQTIFKFKQISIKVNPIFSYEYPGLAKRPQYSILSTAKICTTFNIKLPNWEDALHTCLSNTALT